MRFFVIDFESAVLNSLAQIITNIDQHSILLNEINRRTCMVSSDKLIAPETLPNFPFKTNKEFQEFDKQLETEATVREYMVN